MIWRSVNGNPNHVKATTWIKRRGQVRYTVSPRAVWGGITDTPQYESWRGNRRIGGYHSSVHDAKMTCEQDAQDLKAQAEQAS